MIQTNVETLKNMDWNEVRSSLTIRSTPEGEIVGYLNTMIDKTSGKILEIAQRIRVFDNMAVVPTILKVTGKETFKLELIEEESDLPKAVVEAVSSSFQEFNRVKS